jgi:aryl-alcohol dehydrogenase-like predicted oxidoreductase
VWKNPCGGCETDYLDLVQAHDIEFADYGQVIHETLPELRRLQAAGKVRFVGVTAFPCSVLCEVATTLSGMSTTQRRANSKR